MIFDNKPEHREVLDPRVAFLMDQLLEEVVRSGTGASIWGRGINFPVAGKTGTSHDGWFAGFTSKLICVVWVGFDDNRELNLEGAKSALPVWAEFMKRAHEHREYRNVSEFEAPRRSGQRADRSAVGRACDGGVSEGSDGVFHRRHAAGGDVPLHGGGVTQVAGWETSQPARAAESAATAGSSGSAQQRTAQNAAPTLPEHGAAFAGAPQA